MPRAGQRKWLVVFKSTPTAENEYGEQVPTGDPPTEVARQRVRVRFGTGQERRQAAQETSVQSATLECVRTAAVDAVVATDIAEFDGSDWDIINRSPMDLKEVHFTVTRAG
jgi:hypothetical protein